jgi:TRAP-type C4-dicarboxylate transport system permease small subunit
LLVSEGRSVKMEVVRRKIMEDIKKEPVTKSFITGLIYFGIFLLVGLAFWAADWWSWKLIITVPMAAVAYFCLVGGVGMAMEMIADEEKSSTTS